MKPILDAGCGGSTTFLSNTGIFTGKPRYDVNLDLLIPDDSKANFVRASVLNLPFQEKVFGETVCANVLEHLCTAKDANSAVTELRRISDAVTLVTCNGIIDCNWKINGEWQHKLMWICGRFAKKPVLHNLLICFITRNHYGRWFLTKVFGRYVVTMRC